MVFVMPLLTGEYSVYRQFEFGVGWFSQLERSFGLIGFICNWGKYHLGWRINDASRSLLYFHFFWSREACFIRYVKYNNFLY
jgi:hypothetical protein